MKKISIILALVLMLSFVLCACGVDPIVGTWTTSQDGVSMTMTFNEDGTGNVSALGGLLSFNYTYTAENGKLLITPEEGMEDMIDFNDSTYSIKGDVLSITGEGETVEFTREAK